VPEVVFPLDANFDWARPAAAPVGPMSERTAMSERIWDQVRAAQEKGGLDAVVSYCFGFDVDPSLVERTIGLGVPWINFYCDSTYAFDLVEPLARVTSLNWFPEHAALPSYQA